MYIMAAACGNGRSDGLCHTGVSLAASLCCMPIVAAACGNRRADVLCHAGISLAAAICRILVVAAARGDSRRGRRHCSGAAGAGGDSGEGFVRAEWHAVARPAHTLPQAGPCPAADSTAAKADDHASRPSDRSGPVASMFGSCDCHPELAAPTLGARCPGHRGHTCGDSSRQVRVGSERDARLEFIICDPSFESKVADISSCINFSWYWAAARA
mmetsp:Transcript_166568/g.529254  ORF Transcript_166568/g.529254 Transcript_166568/m.529254 type:complete len:214 (-) Transcript_166568:132-773(-)